MPEQSGSSTAIVGGGLGGLATSVFLARAGRRVTLFERSSHLGGRARTDDFEGFRFNMGAHASYLGGAGASVLKELGVKFTGGSPPLSLSGLKGGRLHPISSSFSSLLSTGLLSFASRLKALRLLAGVKRIKTKELQATTWREWLGQEVESEDLSALLESIFRLVTYSNDPGIASVGPAIEYLGLAFDRVMYIDGGWQTLVDGLAEKASQLGVRTMRGVGVEAIEHDAQVNAVRVSDGTSLPFETVVLAVDAEAACAMLSAGGGLPAYLDDFQRGTHPVRCAVFDVALSELPNPDMIYSLGIDQPFYYSVHSKWAKLAPVGGASVTMTKYLGTRIPPNPTRDREELEQFLDILQPGWRRFAVKSRFLPSMVSSSALVEAAREGLYGRPSPKCSRIDNLYFVGDWVGQEGLLSDATLASARGAAESILRDRPSARPVAQPQQLRGV